jgi:hypothetical protein
VSGEWRAIERTLRAGGSADVVARRIVQLTLRLHRRWRGLRSSVLGLASTDSEVRRFYHAQRRRQFKMLAELRATMHGPTHSQEEDAVLLFTLERTCDAVANCELRDLGLTRTATVQVLQDIVRRHIARHA